MLDIDIALHVCPCLSVAVEGLDDLPPPPPLPSALPPQPVVVSDLFIERILGGLADADAAPAAHGAGVGGAALRGGLARVAQGHGLLREAHRVTASHGGRQGG